LDAAAPRNGAFPFAAAGNGQPTNGGQLNVSGGGVRDSHHAQDATDKGGKTAAT